MTNQVEVTRNAIDAWIVFTDATRRLAIQFPRYDKEKLNPLRLALMPIPQDMSSWTTPRLMKDICDCSSDSFSWKQSRKDLHLHQWAIMHRQEQGWERSNMKYYSFNVAPACEWILISCDPATVDRKERLRGLMYWETHDRKMSGQLHFGDSERQNVTWISTVARGFQIALPLPTDKLVSGIARKTDREIISMLGIDPDSVEKGRE